MPKLFYTAILWTALGAFASAEIIKIPIAQQQAAQAGTSLPHRGLSKEQVAEQFGEPLERQAGVGEPPISRWEYSDYYVYFERDKLLHAAYKHTPQNSTTE